ncbi:MAG TPA: hypothetical protein ENK19_08210, partial [Acidobacteria bacterium]|nr:hypothetical protein [Acidobacteriota bacterium]
MKRFHILGLVFLAMAASGTLLWGGVPGTDIFVPSLARTHGAHGSMWYATAWIHNPGTAEVQVTVSYLRRDQSNPAPMQQTVIVQPGETMKLGDVFQDLFGLEDAKGALRFQSTGKIVVSTRSYNLTTAGLADSQGQFLSGMPAELALAAGEKTSIPGITQPADESFRCNYAMVETVGGTADVRVSLFDRDGVPRASKTYSLAPYQPVQFNLSDLGAGLTVDGGRLDVEVLSGSGKVLTFASMVGNGTLSQDPSTLEMEYELETGGGSGSGVTAGKIASGAVTSGKIADGAVTSSKLAASAVTNSKLASGAVTTSKISASGASSGQVLKASGGSVVWANDETGGLTLPYQGQGSTSGSPLFKVTNASNGTTISANNNSNGFALYAKSASGTAIHALGSGSGHSALDAHATSSGIAVTAIAESGATAALAATNGTFTAIVANGSHGLQVSGPPATAHSVIYGAATGSVGWGVQGVGNASGQRGIVGQSDHGYAVVGE